MKVSLSWLKELVDHNLSPKELAEKLSLMSIGVKQTTDDFLELDLTYNRGDLLALRGVAREVASITNSKVIFENNETPKFDLPESPVTVENPNLCPVYCVAKIEGLRVGNSGNEWVKRLADCGVRSVNNIADVTNLIMLEFGQPMHAFDARGVKDETIIVRTARKGERITTLDGKTRDLETTDLLIADPLNALGIAGVMGGKDSEVSDSTNTILLEAAIFDPVSIRKTAQRLGLHSEASKRFQHGLTKTNLLQALSAAIKMYEELGGKLTAITLVGDPKDKPKTVQLTQKKINSLLGVEIPAEDVEKSLKSLGLHPKGVGTNSWEVTVPYWRLDVNIEEDLIEEVARIYGYEKIEGKPLIGDLPEKLDQTLPNFIYDLKKSLADVGLTEVQTYSFYSTQVLNALGFNESNKENIIRVANPISSETEYLREFIWPNLVEIVGRNMRQGYKDIGIFEVGKIYMPQKVGLPKESYRLAIALMNGTENPVEELISIFQYLGSNLPGCKLKLEGMIKELETIFHPTRFATVEAGGSPRFAGEAGKVIGGLTEVHPRFLNNFGIEERVAVLEIDIENLI